MEAINLRFLVAPLLTPVDSLEIPLPKKAGAEWNYISLKGQEVLKQIPKSTLSESLNYSPLHSMEGWLTIKS
jgi:hypothetical protein